MLEHHRASLVHMTAHYRENPDISALFLIGSVATGTERPDSDLDGVAVVSKAVYEAKKQAGELEEVYFGKCTYEGGYFNVHFMCREEMEALAESGAEAMRSMFMSARALFCDEPDLPALAARIPVFQKQEAAAKQFKYYCTFRMYYNYYWRACRPEGYMRHHVADGMIYCLYRLILQENEILFPSLRKLEETVRRAPNKPEGILESCARFMQTLSDEDCTALVEGYEAWTAYDFPKDHNVVMNHFYDPLDG